MASQDEVVDDPLYDLIQMYMLLHDHPPMSDDLFDRLVMWVQGNLQCDFILAHCIVSRRLFRVNTVYGTQNYTLTRNHPMEPDEELAYQRWRHTDEHQKTNRSADSAP